VAQHLLRLALATMLSSSVAWAQDDGRSTRSDRGDEAIYRRIEQVRRAAAGFRLDGSDRDWRRVPQMADARGDAGGDPGRDIVAAAIAPRKNDLWIMLRTAGKASTENWTFYIEVDLWGDAGDDFRIELQSLRRGPVLRYYDESFQPGEPIPLRRAKVVLHHVMEMRIPYADIAAGVPQEKVLQLSGEKARPWVRIRNWTWDADRQRQVDFGPSVASFRLVETPYPLEPSLPSRRQPPVAVGLPLRGQWFVSQGAMGRFSHQNVWAYDLVKRDSAGFQSSPPTSKQNGEYYAWGHPVFSPIDGRVLRTRSAIEDSPVRELGHGGSPANQVYIASADGFALDLVHLQQGSVTVGAFDRVSAGQQVGLVGNSGHSDVPHLHMAVWTGRFSRRTVPLALTNVRVGLNYGQHDPWARELAHWEPREGLFVEAISVADSGR